jgi:UPF0271 protein
MVRYVDLVADLGEGFGAWTMGDDDALLDIVTSANVACGFHAGDPRTMDLTVRECAIRGVGVGAHPSFPDLVGFGRRALDLSPLEVRTDVTYQIGALSAFARTYETAVAHVAPHGRLGNLVAVRTDYAEAVVEAVVSVDPSLIVLAQEGELERVARKAGLAVAIVGIADRAYEDDGTLVPRSQPGAVIHDAGLIRERTVRMVSEGVIASRNGVDIPVTCDTVLLHGDTPGAVDLARSIRGALEAEGIEIRPLRESLAQRP